ncbi:hypothetical protein [Mycobacterium sp. SMC-4]|uniref:hypothetical protein n=1 Tax=Mycobacterium sp. SMC-4 TaxID=2857059 RepID=UPI003CFCCE9B
MTAISKLAAVLSGIVLTFAGVSDLAPAVADCTSVGGTTLCSQGESRGSDSGGGPSGSSGPYIPYPCEYDYYYCNEYFGWDVDLDWDPGIGVGGPGRPDGPGIGSPGRPGGGVGGGGGIGGGRR